MDKEKSRNTSELELSGRSGNDALEASGITKQDQMKYGILDSEGATSVTVPVTSLGFDVLSVYPEEVEELIGE